MFDNNIIQVQQLLNKDGFLLSDGEFLKKFESPVSPKEYVLVFDAIPKDALQVLKNSHDDTTQSSDWRTNIFTGDLDPKEKL